MNNNIIPYGLQSIDNADIEEVVKVLKSNWLTTGPKISEFEIKFAKYVGSKYAVAVSSGTAALHLACLAAGLKEDEELITTPMTFAASANCAFYCKARPIFVDIKENGLIDEEKIEEIVPDNPRKIYDVREVIRKIVDKSDFFEVKRDFAKNIVTGFARLGGKSIGIIANQPAVLAGALDIKASRKGARFIQFCDAFNIPILSVHDNPAYLPGLEQEHGGIITQGAKMLYAFSEATVPKIILILRKSYGGGNAAMCNHGLRADLMFAWPTAEIAVMGAESAAEILFKREIEKAEDPEQKRLEKIQEYRLKFASPYNAASVLYIDEVIEPKETRERLLKALNTLEKKQVNNPWRKHGIMPF